MIYTLLTPEDQLAILRERVRELEADHYRTTLLLAEVEGVHPDRVAQHHRTLVELERRIVRHVGEPAPDPSAAAPTGEDESDSTDRHGEVADGVSERDPAMIDGSREMLSAVGPTGPAASNGAASSLDE